MNLTDSQLPQVCTLNTLSLHVCLVTILNCMYTQHGSENLDQSFLHFFEQFRVVYIGDVVSKTSGVGTYCVCVCIDAFSSV